MALWEKKKKEHRVSNAVVFLLAFILFLVVFGGLCLWMVVKINEERRGAESSANGFSEVSNGNTFGPEDARNLLIVTVDADQAQGFLAVRSDPANTRMTALAFPRDTVLDYGTSEYKAYELYAEQGIGRTKDALETLSGIRFDNYAVITYANIEKVIDHFEEGLIFTLTESLDYHEGDLNIRLDGGLRTLSSSQVVGMLRYPAWHGGRKQQADIQAQVVAALVNQFLRENRADKADADFSALVNLVKSDIMVSHYNAAKSGLAYLASRNDGTLCVTLSLEGEYEGSGDALRFYAADGVAESLSRTFG